MALFDNSDFEAIATNNMFNSKTGDETSFTNPFGLKDFSKMLDNKFGNSAFSSNILEAPKGNSGNSKAVSNPFDTEGKWAKPNMDDYKYDAKSVFSSDYSAPSSKTDNILSTGNSKDESIFEKVESAAVKSIFEGITINKGTGMAKGGRTSHKLDFCY